jgi:hypothetical protein
LAYAKFQGKKELTTHFEKNINIKSATDEMNPYIASINNKTPGDVEIPIVKYNLK